MNRLKSFDDLLAVESKAVSLGFAGVSFLPFKNPSGAFRKFYRSYLKKNQHAEMHYLENISAKYNLKKLWPHSKEPKTIIAFVHPYRHKKTEEAAKKGAYKIARYAWGADYHIHLRKKLKSIAKEFTFSRIIIDSTPLPERYYARQSGLGFVGRNGMLIHPHWGSYFFLSFLFVSEKVSKSALGNFYQTKGLLTQKKTTSIKHDIMDWCKDCKRCVNACPTDALVGGGVLDANKCISYWTIESRSENIGLDGRMGKWIFGCDICQKVCPYNDAGLFSLDEKFSPDQVSVQVSSGKIEELEQQDLFGLALKRAGVNGLLRNKKKLSKRI